MYVSNANECYALDAGSGRMIWHFQRPRTKGLAGNAAIGFNRGVAAAGDRIFMLTDNAHMIALNRFSGELHVGNRNGRLASELQRHFRAAGGREHGRFRHCGRRRRRARLCCRLTIRPPGKKSGASGPFRSPASPASETWKGNSLEHPSGATWMTGTYDPQLDTIYLAGRQSRSRTSTATNAQGDNLYTDSIVALDSKTGKMKWYYQFTPHDVHDWDAQEPAVLVDANWQGQPRKLLLQANRNGFFYVLDRTNGQLLLAKPFLKKLNWAEAIGKDGRPILNTLKENAEGETYVCPGFQGGTNWFSTSFNPAHGPLLFQALERCNLFSKRTMEWQAGKGYMGGAARPAPGETFEKVLRAINIQTGEITWELPQVSGTLTASAGALSTASGLVFFGENSGAFMAADATNGKALWQFPTNQTWKASPMTYMFDNKQYVAVAAGQNIIAFALPE